MKNLKQSIIDYMESNCDQNKTISISMDELKNLLGENSHGNVQATIKRLKNEGKISVIKKGVCNSPTVYKVQSEITVLNNGDISVREYSHSFDNIRQIAETAVQAIVTIVDIATEAQKQTEELSKLNSQTNDKLAKIMEVLYGKK